MNSIWHMYTLGQGYYYYGLAGHFSFLHPSESETCLSFWLGKESATEG